MPQNKTTLSVIVLILLLGGMFSYKLYGYIEHSFDELTNIEKESKQVTANTHKIKSKTLVLLTTNHSPVQSQRLQDTSSEASQQKRQTKQAKSSFLCVRPPLKKISTIRQPFIETDGTRTIKAIKKYYELNTNLGEGFEPFLAELKLRLNAAFMHMEHKLSIQLNRTISLNLVFQTTREDYEDYITELGLSPAGSQGMYIYPNNIAVIEYKDHQQGMRTAIHEAIHAFNRAYWGSSLRFFNEGMAEYLEAISQNGSMPAFDFSPLTSQQYPLQISTLLFSEINWHGSQQHELYENSKALFYFLMNNSVGRQLFWALMKQEIQDPCSTLSQETISNLFFELFPNHQQEFDYWFSDGLIEFLENQ